MFRIQELNNIAVEMSERGSLMCLRVQSLLSVQSEGVIQKAQQVTTRRAGEEGVLRVIMLHR